MYQILSDVMAEKELRRICAQHQGFLNFIASLQCGNVDKVVGTESWTGADSNRRKTCIHKSNMKNAFHVWWVRIRNQNDYTVGISSPSANAHNWITRRKHLLVGHSTFRGFNTPEHPRHPPLELKLKVLHRFFESGEGNDCWRIAMEIFVAFAPEKAEPAQKQLLSSISSKDFRRQIP